MSRRGSRSTRGVSLIELMASVVLLLGLLYMLGDLFRITRQAQRHVALTEEGAAVRQRLRRRLGEALQLGWPLEALGVERAPSSQRARLAERPDPQTPQWGSPSALVCRTDAGYRVICLHGRELVELVLAPGRVAEVLPLVDHVVSARLVTQRDRAGAVQGVIYALQVQPPDQGAPIPLEGFVAARRERPPLRQPRIQVRLPEGW